MTKSINIHIHITEVNGNGMVWSVYVITLIIRLPISLCDALTTVAAGASKQ